MAEGGSGFSATDLQKALAEVMNDSKLSNDQKRSWSGRIKAFYGKIQSGAAVDVAEATL